MNRKQQRQRRSRSFRAKAKERGVIRLCVHRTPRHIYAQVISACGKNVIVSASTLEKEINTKLENTGNVVAAELIGKTVAERAKKAGYEKVSYDRSGFKYHGRVKALADAARAGGLQF